MVLSLRERGRGGGKLSTESEKPVWSRSSRIFVVNKVKGISGIWGIAAFTKPSISPIKILPLKIKGGNFQTYGAKKLILI